MGKSRIGYWLKACLELEFQFFFVSHSTRAPSAGDNPAPHNPLAAKEPH